MCSVSSKRVALLVQLLYVLHCHSSLDMSLLLGLNHLNQGALSDAQWQSQVFTLKHIRTPAHYHVDFI